MRDLQETEEAAEAASEVVVEAEAVDQLVVKVTRVADSSSLDWTTTPSPHWLERPQK